MNQTSFLKYLQFEKRFSNHTIDAYRRDLEQFLAYIEDVYELKGKPEEINHLHIRSWMVHLLNEKLSARSINRKLSTLKTYFNFLLKRGHVQKNPTVKIISPKTGKKLPDYIDHKHLDLLFEQLPFTNDFCGVRDRFVIEILYHTGMRRSELLALKLPDIDLNRRQLKVLGKGNKERIIPFGTNLEKLITNYLDIRSDTFPESITQVLILTEKGKPAYPKLIYNIVHRYLSLISTVEQRSPHTLRHTFATHLSENGADLNAIKALLGHSNLAATQIYMHNSIEQLKKVYQAAHPKSRLSEDNLGDL